MHEIPLGRLFTKLVTLVIYREGNWWLGEAMWEKKVHYLFFFLILSHINYLLKVKANMLIVTKVLD